jgi:hypothetical protein
MQRPPTTASTRSLGHQLGHNVCVETCGFERCNPDIIRLRLRVGSLQAGVGHGYQLLRLTLERKRLIIRQLCLNAGKISWKTAGAAGRHQPL